MEKYKQLEKHLFETKFEIWRTSFTEVERILGFKLPTSARKHQAWWANEDTHSQSKSWLEAGYITTELDIEGETVSFIKSK